MKNMNLIYRVHAIERMFQRDIDKKSDAIIIIVYRPSLKKWKDDFKTRRSQS